MTTHTHIDREGNAATSLVRQRSLCAHVHLAPAIHRPTSSETVATASHVVKLWQLPLPSYAMDRAQKNDMAWITAVQRTGDHGGLECEAGVVAVRSAGEREGPSPRKAGRKYTVRRRRAGEEAESDGTSLSPLHATGGVAGVASTNVRPLAYALSQRPSPTSRLIDCSPGPPSLTPFSSPPFLRDGLRGTLRRTRARSLGSRCNATCLQPRGVRARRRRPLPLPPLIS